MESVEEAVVELLHSAVEKLESIDKSIDFLASSLTGMDPLDIQLQQHAYGRLARPSVAQREAPPRERERSVDEEITVSAAVLEEVIEGIVREEVLKELDLPTGPTAPGELADDADRDCLERGGEWVQGRCVEKKKKPQRKKWTPSSEQERSFVHDREWPPGFPE